MKASPLRTESGKPHQPDPPRREKSNMDAPQEEFIESQAVPSQTKQSAQESSESGTRKQVS
jgi:hypothetical protein